MIARSARAGLVSFVLSIATFSPTDATAQIDVVAPAQTAYSPGLGGHVLSGTETRRSSDGTNIALITFSGVDRIFHYSPPFGWKIRTGNGPTLLSKGNVTATLAIATMNSPNATLTVAEKKVVRNQVVVGVAERPEQTEHEVLPLHIAGEPATKSTFHYDLGGRAYLKQKIKSVGENWQVECELNGPESEVRAAEPVLLRSLCSIDLQTNETLRRAAAEKEKDDMAKIASQQRTPARSTSAGRVRGRLE